MGPMFALSAPGIRALANLKGAFVGQRTERAREKAETRALDAKEFTKMRYRTAVKTGRTAAMQADALHPGSFVRYAAMVENLSVAYIRSLEHRSRPAPKPTHKLAS
jgi:hypothetical protein